MVLTPLGCRCFVVWVHVGGVVNCVNDLRPIVHMVFVWLKSPVYFISGTMKYYRFALPAASDTASTTVPIRE